MPFPRAQRLRRDSKSEYESKFQAIKWCAVPLLKSYVPSDSICVIAAQPGDVIAVAFHYDSRGTSPALGRMLQRRESKQYSNLCLDGRSRKKMSAEKCCG